jgi:hypothetical protein
MSTEFLLFGVSQRGGDRQSDGLYARVLTKFEFPALLVLLYVRVASLFYIERVGPDQF